MSPRQTMSAADIELLANELRLTIQASSCCPLHASEVLMHVMASFVLDSHGDSATRAAAEFTRAAQVFASRIRRGDYFVVRAKQ